MSFHSYFQGDDENYSVYTTDGRPERKLLIAVLHRAVLDLSSKDLHEVKDALEWFREIPGTTPFSYKNLLDIISLSQKELNELDTYIEDGQKYLDAARESMKINHTIYTSDYRVDASLFLSQATIERNKRRVRMSK